MKTREGKQKTGLRRKAEQQLKLKRKPPADLLKEDFQKLIHELEVHQIELELQNEELRETQYALEVSRNRYVELYDFAPVGYFILDKKSMILEVNLTGADLLGVERQNLKKTRFNHFIVPGFQDIFHKHCVQVFNSTVRQSCTVQCKKKDGTLFYVQLESKAEQACLSGKNTMLTAVIDITERKQAQDALKKLYDELECRVNERTADLQFTNEQLHIEVIERRQAEEQVRFNESRLETLLKLGEMAEGTIKEIADFVCEELVRLTQSSIGFLGFMNDDESVMILHAYSKSVMEECTVADQLLHFPINKAGIWGEVIRKKEPLIVNDYSLSNPYKKGYPKGHVSLLRFVAVPVIQSKRVVAVATVGNKETDYTAEDVRQMKLLMEGMNEIIVRKQTQDDLKQSEKELQSLSAQLIDSQESERKRVAQELHDSVGQTLSALKFRVENILRQSGENLDHEYHQSFISLIPQIKESIIEINRIGRGLRPSMLDDLGVLAALSWFCREFALTYSGIHIQQKIALEEDDVPENLKVVIYRVLQESLNNIAKHSNAALVELSLKKAKKTLELSIKDNGSGFDLEYELSQSGEKGRLGLAGMMKRIDLSGGVCNIISEKNKGTHIKALWQL